MPIMLDDLQANAPVKVYAPKFFDSQLTGSGKKTGVLNENLNPANVYPAQGTPSENLSDRRKKYTSGATTTSVIPMWILGRNVRQYMTVDQMPSLTEMAKIYDGPIAVLAKNPNALGPIGQVYMHLEVSHVVLQKTTLHNQANGGFSKKCLPTYQVTLYFVQDVNDITATKVNAISEFNPVKNPLPKVMTDNRYYMTWTCNVPSLLDQYDAALQAALGIQVDMDAMKNYLQTFSVYDSICKQSETWQTHVHEVLDRLFQNVSTHYAGNVPAMNAIAFLLWNLEDYAIPLDLYRNIYASIIKWFPTDTAETLCKQNLNLLLSDTLNSLNSNKKALTCVPQTNQPAAKPGTIARFSPEQQKAITTTEPLVLVQAGAGTGKSTVILARIDWMIRSGINPEDITVLSFTNAAADHIRDLNPDVHSMTIASMIHNIYAANFPTHELSSIDTIINSLEIYFPNDPMADRFEDHCKRILKNDSDAFTRMNNFVEAHYDDVIRMLNTLKQTSLELEIIICYQQIENFIEPANVQSKYLIIDEVQDNSIFEFIYALKYVDKHKESLFIVGDCSQTLYEFRASNPKALNVLEGSGVFAAYQLQVNYRSNQEILDFANIALQNIEANQYANIQLRANSLRPVTLQSFTDAVQFKYHQVRKLADFHDMLPNLFQKDLMPYIDRCLARGEQVAFLAFTRRQIDQLQTIIKANYPNATVASLVPQKVYNTTVFSSFIKNYWGGMKFTTNMPVVGVITRSIMDNLDNLVYQATPTIQNKVAKMLADWDLQYQGIIAQWQYQYLTGSMTEDEYLQNIKESLLQFEIRNNAVRQAVLSARNEEAKNNQAAASADIVLSTIHSAKGLEFQNVVVVYQNQQDIQEDKKRMYYVAFTRAMNSEYIMAYDTVPKPRIEADYKTILDQLTKITPQPAPTASLAVNTIDQVSTLVDAANGSTAAEKPFLVRKSHDSFHSIDLPGLTLSENTVILPHGLTVMTHEEAAAYTTSPDLANMHEVHEALDKDDQPTDADVDAPFKEISAPNDPDAANIA